MNDEQLRYPVGRWEMPEEYNAAEIQEWTEVIELLPTELSNRLERMNADMLETTYRPGGWTGAQVVHHMADSHMNAIIRFKWALTEDDPEIKPYYEERWAELPDGKSLNVLNSLAILKGVHSRWVQLLNSMNQADYERSFFHPANKTNRRLYQYLSLYAWHSRHHLGHLDIIINSKTA